MDKFLGILKTVIGIGANVATGGLAGGVVNLVGRVFGQKSSVTDAVGEVADVIGGVLDKKEDADSLRMKMIEHRDELHAGILCAMVKSKNWFVADAPAFILWVAGIGLALYILTRYGVASYDWVRHYVVTGDLEEYPISSQDIWHLLAATGSFGLAHGVREGGKAIAQVLSKRHK